MSHFSKNASVVVAACAASILLLAFVSAQAEAGEARLGMNLAGPADVFVDLGLAIKQANPFATTLVIELCECAPGYIPTEKAFAEGSYETVNSRIAPGGGERMTQTAIRLLKGLAQS